MTNIKKLSNQSETFILIAPGFEEQFVVDCLCKIREEGLPVWLVGLTNGLVNGARGLTVRPDFSLGQLEVFIPFQTGYQLVLPGNQTCAAMLLSDPRVHQLINAMIDADGYIVTTPHSEAVLAQTNPIVSQVPTRFLRQNGTETAEYMQQVIHLMEEVNKPFF